MLPENPNKNPYNRIFAAHCIKQKNILAASFWFEISRDYRVCLQFRDFFYREPVYIRAASTE